MRSFRGKRGPGEGKGNIMYLTKNELEIMDVLWREGRALSRGEILSLSGDKNWMDS